MIRSTTITNFPHDDYDYDFYDDDDYEETMSTISNERGRRDNFANLVLDLGETCICWRIEPRMLCSFFDTLGRVCLDAWSARMLAGWQFEGLNRLW